MPQRSADTMNSDLIRSHDASPLAARGTSLGPRNSDHSPRSGDLLQDANLWVAPHAHCRSNSARSALILQIVVFTVSCRATTKPANRSVLSYHVSGHVLDNLETEVVIVATDLERHTPAMVTTTDRAGAFKFDSSSRKLAITAAQPHGFAYLPEIMVGQQPLTIALTNDCHRTRGRIRDRTAILDARNLVLRFERYSDKTGDIFGATIKSSNEFEICLPSGDYLLTMPGGLISQRTAVSIPAPIDLDLVVTKHEIAAAPPLSTGGLQSEADTAFLEQAANNTRLIGLGESNHGTDDFVREQARLSILLAAKHGFRAIVLEAGYGEALALDDYVCGSNIDIIGSIKRLGYYTWSTVGLLDSLQAIREYNTQLEEHSGIDRRLHVLGIDVQDSRGAAEYLIEHQHMDTSRDEGRLFALLAKDEQTAWRKFTTSERDQLLAALRSISSRRDQNGLDSVINRGALCARVLQLYLDYLEAVNNGDSFRRRDRAIASMATEILGLSPDLKAVVWAHLEHLARTYTVGSPSAGTHLASTFANQYRVYALLTRTGSVRVRDPARKNELSTIPLQKLRGTSLEEMLSSDLQEPQSNTSFWQFDRATDAAREWLQGLRFVRSFGAVYPGPEGSFLLYDLSSIDGAILFQRVTPSRPLGK